MPGAGRVAGRRFLNQYRQIPQRMNARKLCDDRAVTSEPEAGRSDGLYHDVSKIHDHEGLAGLIWAMHADLAARPEAWENPRLDLYLEALAALIGSLDHVMANRGEPTPAQPTWALIGSPLLGAALHE
jgi:hypothetical protein